MDFTQPWQCAAGHGPVRWRGDPVCWFCGSAEHVVPLAEVIVPPSGVHTYRVERAPGVTPP